MVTEAMGVVILLRARCREMREPSKHQKLRVGQRNMTYKIHLSPAIILKP